MAWTPGTAAICVRNASTGAVLPPIQTIRGGLLRHAGQIDRENEILFEAQRLGRSERDLPIDHGGRDQQGDRDGELEHHQAQTHPPPPIRPPDPAFSTCAGGKRDRITAG